MALIEIITETAGTVWKINVNTGDEVKTDQTLMILEAMKMEIPIPSPEDGRVKEIKVKLDDLVKEQDVVSILET
jgi:acetyl-CoA carboxylase biotin carboxyl carrier protein